MDKLETERDRVLPPLGEAGVVLAPNELPDDTGLYALWPASEQSLNELGLDDRPGVASLMTRPLWKCGLGLTSRKQC